MNERIQIFFGHTLIFATSSKSQLIKKLEEIYDQFETSSPFLSIGHMNGDYLNCGISQECNFVIYHHKDDVKLRLPSYTSVGDDAIQLYEAPYYLFSMHDRKTEMYGRACISFTDFLRIIEYFFENGTRPLDLIKWDKEG